MAITCPRASTGFTGAGAVSNGFTVAGLLNGPMMTIFNFVSSCSNCVQTKTCAPCARASGKTCCTALVSWRHMMIQLFDAVYLAMLMFHIQRTHHHNRNHIQCTTTDTHQCSHTPYHHDLMSYIQDKKINRLSAVVLVA